MPFVELNFPGTQMRDHLATLNSLQLSSVPADGQCGGIMAQRGLTPIYKGLLGAGLLTENPASKL